MDRRHQETSSTSPLAYEKSFLRPAHRYNFHREKVPKDGSIRLPKSERYRNRPSKSCVSDGFFRIRGHKLPLPNFHNDKYGLFRKNVTRGRKGRGFKGWLLTVMEPDNYVDFIGGDLDLHDDTEEERSRFQEDIHSITGFAKAIGAQVIWTTSPGDLFDGKHIQGLYFYIKLDRPLRWRRLVALTPLIKKFYHIREKLEFFSDHQGRLFRLPAQEYQDKVVMAPETNSFCVLPPTGDTEEERNESRLATFMLDWTNLKPANTRSIFLPALRQRSRERNWINVRKRKTLVEFDFNSPTAASNEKEKASPSTTPLKIKNNLREPAKSTSTNVLFTVNFTKEIPSAEKLSKQGNPFGYLTSGRIISRLIHQVRGDRQHQEQVIDQAKAIMAAEYLPHTDTDGNRYSHTVRDEAHFHHWVSSIVDWYFRTYIPFTPSSDTHVHQKRQDEDQVAIEETLDCIDEDFEVLIKFIGDNTNAPRSLLFQIQSFLAKISEWTGRVGYEALHEIFGGEYKWYQKRKLIETFFEYDDYVKPHFDEETGEKKAKGKCKRWKLQSWVIDGVKKLKEMMKKVRNARMRVKLYCKHMCSTLFFYQSLKSRTPNKPPFPPGTFCKSLKDWSWEEEITEPENSVFDEFEKMPITLT